MKSDNWKDYYLCSPEDIQAAVTKDRLRPVLIRCGSGRLTCPAQDAQHWIDIIKREDSDYIRDVSYPAGY